jgi:plasmid stabilization system protein ParE
MDNAISDLAEIKYYIAQRSKYYAQITIQKIRTRTQILKQYIELGRIVPEYDNNTIREIIEGNYRIIYHIYSKNEIWILAIVHGARDLTKIKFEMPK